MKCFAVW